MTRAGAVGLLCLGVLGWASTGCASTGADWRERYLEKERDANDLAGQLSEERNARAAAVAQLEEANARIGNLEQENHALKDRSLAAPVAAAPVEDSGAALDSLKRKGIDAYQTADGNIAIVLPADINFGPGSKDLTAAGRKAVDGMAGELNGQFAGYTVRIEGHTDGDPIRKSKFSDNWELGAERSLAVLRHLQKQHGIAAERLVAASRGETMPVADNKSDKGKARNRRVELVVIVPRDAAAAK